MKALLQRVNYSRVIVQQDVIASIDQGILVLIGIESSDTQDSITHLTDKILHYRLFSDHIGKMNLNVMDIQGSVLFVPQFTLVSNTKKGLRPDFKSAGDPEQSKYLFEHLIDHAKNIYKHIKFGVFGANMAIELCNDGPVTFMLEN